jgi:hypothetical protein
MKLAERVLSAAAVANGDDNGDGDGTTTGTLA